MIAGKTEPFIMLLIGMGLGIHPHSRTEKFIKAPYVAGAEQKFTS